MDSSSTHVVHEIHREVLMNTEVPALRRCEGRSLVGALLISRVEGRKVSRVRTRGRRARPAERIAESMIEGDYGERMG